MAFPCFFLFLLQTYVGDVLVALNPFAPLPGLYSPETQHQYVRFGKDALAPHVYYMAYAALV